MSTRTNLARIGHTDRCPDTCPHWARLIAEAEARHDDPRDPR